MRARKRRISPIALPLTLVVAITIAATVMLRPSTVKAAPVEYVKVCSLYGAGFLYLPGTDTCVNFAKNDAREQAANKYLVSQLPACPSPNVLVTDATDPSCTLGGTPMGGGNNTCPVACVSGAWQFTKEAGGTWRWRVPNNPRKWVPTPQDACQDGRLVRFGDVTRSGLNLNAYSRYETSTHYRLALWPGEYIKSVLYKGGFTGVGRGNFCMYYYYNDPKLGPNYSPLGCIDTASQASVPATLAFSPDKPIPPATGNQTFLLGANGQSWGMTPDIQGKLSVWLCLQDAPGPGAPY
jgi:hypothetical protein